MFFDGLEQEVRVLRSLLVDLLAGDDLVLCFLDLHHFAELGRLTGLALSDDLGLWLKETHDFFREVRIAAKDAYLRLLDDMAYEFCHSFQFLLQLPHSSCSAAHLRHQLRAT